MTTSSFLTRAHNVHRLRWLLKDAGPDSAAISSFLEKLAAAGQNAKRDELKTLLAAFQGKGTATSESFKSLMNDFGALSAGAKSLVIEAAKDLEQALNDDSG